MAKLAGVAGWYNVFNDDEVRFPIVWTFEDYLLNSWSFFVDILQCGFSNGNVYLLVSLLPTAVLTLVSLYLSIMLWRYGISHPWLFTCLFATPGSIHSSGPSQWEQANSLLTISIHHVQRRHADLYNHYTDLDERGGQRHDSEP